MTPQNGLSPPTYIPSPAKTKDDEGVGKPVMGGFQEKLREQVGKIVMHILTVAVFSTDKSC